MLNLICRKCGGNIIEVESPDNPGICYICDHCVTEFEMNGPPIVADHPRSSPVIAPPIKCDTADPIRTGDEGG